MDFEPTVVRPHAAFAHPVQMTDLAFGCAKSLELAELCELTAAIVESSLRSFPRIRRQGAPCSET